MKVFITLLLILTSCATPAEQRILTDNANEAERIKASIAENTMAGGWTVICNDDQYTATTTCRAGKFSKRSEPFQVFYENNKGPYIMAGFNTYPGRNATVRVDNGKVLDAKLEASEIVAALSKGKTAYVIYNSWPNGAIRTEIDLIGFPEAYDRLQSLLSK